MRMQRLTAVLLALMLALAACGGAASSGSGQASDAPADPTDAGESAQAADFPTEDVIMINPFPAGNYEVQSRAFAPIFQRHLPTEVRVVVENVEGGSGVIGFNQLINSPEDGHYLANTSTHSDALRYLANLDTAEWEPSDWRWIGGWFGEQPGFGVRPDFPASSLEELSNYDGEVIFATPGAGTLNHGHMVLMATVLGLDARYVHYASTSDARTAMARGEVDAYIAPASTIAEWVDAGELKWIMVLREDEDPMNPDVPTLADAGLDQEVVDDITAFTGSIRGWVTNPGVPDDRLAVLREAFWNAANDPEWTAFLEEQQIESGPVRGEEIDEFVASFWPDFPERWAELVGE